MLNLQSADNRIVNGMATACTALLEGGLLRLHWARKECVGDCRWCAGSHAGDEVALLDYGTKRTEKY